MPEGEEKEGFWSIVLGVVKNFFLMVGQFFKMKNKRIEQKDNEEFRKNEEAKREIIIRNEAEDLVEASGNPKKKEDALDEIRKRVAG